MKEITIENAIYPWSRMKIVKSSGTYKLPNPFHTEEDSQTLFLSVVQITNNVFNWLPSCKERPEVWSFCTLQFNYGPRWGLLILSLETTFRDPHPKSVILKIFKRVQ